MAERHQQSRLRAPPRNTGPAVTTGTVPLTTPQWCTHWTSVKYIQANACQFRAANHPCTSGCPWENFRNRGPTRYPTAPTPTTNVSENIEDTQEAALTLCKANPPVVFHQDSRVFSPRVHSTGEEWPALPARTDITHAAPALTKTTNPDPATPAAGSSSERNSNCARPKDSQTESPSPPANQYSDVKLVASTEESDGDSDYAKLTEDSPTNPANMPDLAGHIRKLEEMHKVAERNLVKLARPTVIFSCIDDLKLPEIYNAETNPAENLQENGAMPLVRTQKSSPYSLIEDASLTPDAPPPYPHVEAGDTAFQAQEGDLPDICLLGADYILGKTLMEE